MSAKFAASCSSVRTEARSGADTYCSLLSAPCSYTHPDNVDESRYQEANEPRPIVDPAEHPGLRRSLQRRDETGQTRCHADGERADRRPVEPARVFVGPVALVEVVHDQLAVPHQEV